MEAAEGNKDVLQSYIFTVAKYEFSVYEKRIIYRLVERAQDELDGIMIRDNMRKIEPHFFGRTITMPVRDILANEADKNYLIAKKSFKSLALKGIDYEDGGIWQFTQLIGNPKIDKTGGIATFEVFNEVWQCFLDFSKGFRKYELLTAMRFKSIYSMRFYELMSGQKNPLRYTLEHLKQMFKLENKYKRPDYFEKNVIQVAQKELDECSPYSFTYAPDTVPSRGRNKCKVIGYTFFPKYNPNNRDPQLEDKSLQAQVSLSGRFGMLPDEASDYLLHVIGFTKDGLNANKDLFIRAASKYPDLTAFFAQIWQQTRKKGKGVGYFINAVKNQLEGK